MSPHALAPDAHASADSDNAPTAGDLGSNYLPLTHSKIGVNGDAKPSPSESERITPAKLHEEPANIPVLDYRLLRGTPEEHEAALKQIDESFQSHGFIYLSNHGIPQETVDEAFAWSKSFFGLPLDVKEEIAHPASGGADDHRGFARAGLGHVSQLVFDRDQVDELRKTAPECKETLEMGNPHDVGPDVPLNRWLEEPRLPGFRAFVESWWDQCAQLEHNLLGYLCEALRIPDRDTLSKKQTRDVCHMSMAFYPSMPIAPLHSRALRRLNAHTDFGQLTLLFQDMVGGLEVHDGKVFRPVIPRPGTVVVNVGDMLERQTNGRWKSALHQVVSPTEETLRLANGGDEHAVEHKYPENVVDRYSIIFFGSPDPESWVATLPGCEDRGSWNPNMIGEWGEEMTAGDWIQKRLAVEY